MTKSMLTLVVFVALGSVTRAADIERIRLTPDAIAAKESSAGGAGTSGVAGIQMTILLGDPTKPGLYTIRLSVPANTRIQAHTHRDSRSALVVSGVWYFGYGSEVDESATKPLPPGSVYSEPAGVAHFALTRAEPVVAYITGYGPTDTVYVNAANDPRHK